MMPYVDAHSKKNSVCNQYIGCILTLLYLSFCMSCCQQGTHRSHLILIFCHELLKNSLEPDKEPCEQAQLVISI